MYSLFDYAFAPTRIVVVSEERLKQAERDATQERIEAIDVRINELTKCRETLAEELKVLTPAKDGKDLNALDGGTHDG